MTAQEALEARYRIADRIHARLAVELSPPEHIRDALLYALQRALRLGSLKLPTGSEEEIEAYALEKLQAMSDDTIRQRLRQQSPEPSAPAPEGKP